MRTLKLSLVLLFISALCGFEAVASSNFPKLREDFEGYALGSGLHGQSGWTSKTPAETERIVVRGDEYGGGWGTHGRYLVVNGWDSFAYSPELNTSTSPAVRFSLDVRPGDAVASPEQWAAIIYCYASDGGIVSIKLAGSDTPGQGPIQVTDGGHDNYRNTGYQWAYINNNSNYHLELTINQTRFNRTWKLRVNNEPPVTGNWGGFFDCQMGQATLQRIVLRGGYNNQPGGLIAYDNIVVEGVEPDRAVDGDPEILVTNLAQYLDDQYYAAGTRVDIARFDLQERRRQGLTVPVKLVTQLQGTDRELRKHWLALEEDRRKLLAEVRLTPANDGQYQLRIENLGSDTAGESGWFGFRWAALVYPDDRRVQLAPNQFKGNAYRDNYSYQCEAAPAGFVHGRGSATHTAVAYFDLPTAPVADMYLELSGLDDDKPGCVPIRVMLNGRALFEGPNAFREVGWSEQTYPVPKSVWKAPVPAISVREAMLVRLGSWHERIEAFAQWSQQQADKVDRDTRPLRESLVWQQREFPGDWWQRGFIRGLCFQSDKLFPPDSAGRPWFNDNYEYVAKACAEAKVNLLYFYPAAPTFYPLFAQHNRQIGLPVVECNWSLGNLLDREPDVYLNPEKEAQSAIAYVRSLGKGDSELRGLALDEPRFVDTKEEEFARLPEIMSAFREYLTTRSKALTEAGIVLPDPVEPVLKVKSVADRVLWMEWQYFKMAYLTNYFARVSQLLAQENMLLLPIIQDYLRYEPQVAPYYFWGARLPIVATDLYNNTNINEAYALDLLASVNHGRTLLVTGSGYSAKTPDRFHRALANGLVRADGVLQWIYTYASKYRAHYFFAKPYIKDDRGREALDNWRPEYWDIQTKVYAGAAQADPYLGGTKSAAEIAVLYSMRSVIAESATGYFWGNTGLFNSLMTYNALIDSHRPVDGCMVEGLTPEHLQRYRVMFLMDAPALSPTECEALRQWVRSGGTLVGGGNTSRLDQWGRERADYELTDLFGVRFQSMKQGAKAFEARFPETDRLQVTYDPSYQYALVTPTSATILGRWENGDPALLMNRVGQGTVYFLTAQKPGYYSTTSDPLSGLYTESRPGFPKLLREIAQRHSGLSPISIEEAPQGLEVQVRRKGPVWIVHLLDWRDGRTVTGLRLRVNEPGAWRLLYPLDGADGGMVAGKQAVIIRPVRVHEMLILRQQ